MDPGELQSIADASGMPIEHFDGYSVLHHPESGPMVVAHAPAARVPAPRTSGGESPPPVDRVPPALARPPAPTVGAPESIAIDPAYAEALARDRVHLHSLELQDLARAPTPARDVVGDFRSERARAAEYGVREPLRGASAVLEENRPRTGASTASRGADRARPHHVEDRAADRAAAATRDARRFTELTAGQAPTLTPPAAMVDEPMSVAPEAGPAMSVAPPMSFGAAVPPPPYTAGTPALDAIAASAAPGFTPSAAPVSTPESAAPRGPGGLPVARRSGDVGPPQAPASPGGMPLPPPASDATIADLAQGGIPQRREPDLIDRQQLLDQQVAAAGREDAIRQGAAERQAEQQRQELEQDRSHAMLGARQAYQNAVDRVASAHLDPSRWFRDQGAGGTIAATLAVALGAFGQAFSGGDRNLALEEINQAIDRDIEAQGADIESGRAAADMQGNMIGIMRSEYGDRDAAREAARAAMLRQVALQTQAHTADLADDEARLHADQTRQQLEAAANEADNDAVTRELAWRQSAAQTARLEAQAAHEMRLARPGGAAAQRAPHIATPQWEAFNHALAGTGGNVERAARLSFDENAITPELLSELRAPTTDAQRSSLDALSASLDQLDRVSGEGQDIPGVGLWDSTLPGPEGRQVRQEIENATSLLAGLRSGAAITEDEYNRFTHILGASQLQTEDEFRHGLSIIRRELGSRLGRTASGIDAPDRDLADVGGEWVE